MDDTTELETSRRPRGGRSMDRMDKEIEEEDEAECKENLEEALTNQSKIVQQTVNTEGVGEGHGFFGRVPTGEIVFIPRQRGARC